VSAGLAGWCALGRCAKCPGADCECECHPGRESAAVPTEAGTGAGAVAVQVRTPLRVLGATASTRVVVTAGVPLTAGRMVGLAGMSAGSSTAQAATLLLSRAELNGSAPKTEFARLLAALGWEPTERLSVDWMPVGGEFRGTIYTAASAPEAVVARSPSACVWFGTQALHQDATGRGKARDVVGWRSLNADLDYMTAHKVKGVPDEAAARTIIGEVSALLGVEPVALVHSGHGLQPHWRVERGSETDWPNAEDGRYVEATALSRRFGRLVEQVVTSHGWHVDKVSDLSRVMRVPGTTNRKAGRPPVDTRVEFTEAARRLDQHSGLRCVLMGGVGTAAVPVEAIRSACETAGIDEAPADRSVVGLVVSTAADWPWATAECGWAQRMVAGWATDLPRGDRHNWLLYQATRMDCAYRYGCFTEAGYTAAVAAVVTRFEALLADPKWGVRAPTPGEVERALDDARQRAEGKTTAEIESELGDLGKHSHAWSARRLRVPLDIGDPFAGMTYEPTAPPIGGNGSEPPEDEPLRDTPPDVLARVCPLCHAAAGTECHPAGWQYVAGAKYHLKRVPHGDQVVRDDSFWDARERFGYVRALARDRLTSPYAVLGEVLLRVAACTPPGVMLPPLRGGPASLNLFVALVGPSGSGKDTARDVAGEVVTGARSDPSLGIGDLSDVNFNPYEDDPFGGGFRPRFIIRTPGSGEGIPGLFGYSEKVKGTNRYQVIRSEPDSVMMEVSELDMLLALGARAGATILPVLRTAYNGKALGFTNRDGATTIPIAAHTYRLTVSVGVQPLRAQPLLDDADGGLPQRFLWLPTHDPSGRAWREQGHPTPERRPPWEPPSFAGAIELAVPEVVREAVIEAAMPLAELVAVNPLDGHAVLAREKVAALLGILDGRPEVSVEDWQLAGHLMDVSDRERASVQAILTTKAVEDGERRARTAGKHAVIVDDTKYAAGVRRLAQRTAGRLRVDGGWVGGAKIRKWAAGRDREYVEDALRSLVAAAVVDSKSSDGAGSAGLLYRVRS